MNSKAALADVCERVPVPGLEIDEQQRERSGVRRLDAERLAPVATCPDPTGQPLVRRVRQQTLGQIGKRGAEQWSGAAE
jgi:hypothetical protein